MTIGDRGTHQGVPSSGQLILSATARLPREVSKDQTVSVISYS